MLLVGRSIPTASTVTVRRNVDQAVVDSHEPKRKVIHHRGRKQMGLVMLPAVGSFTGRSYGKFRSVARCCWPRYRQETPGDHRHRNGSNGFSVRKEETWQKVCRFPVEFLVPVGSELIVSVLAGFADNERSQNANWHCRFRDQHPLRVFQAEMGTGSRSHPLRTGCS